MKRIIFIIFSLIAIIQTAIFAAPVDENVAKQIAQKTLSTKIGGNDFLTIRRAPASNANAKNQFYIFAAENGKGFIIIASDDRAHPILGYSLDGTIDENNLPPNMKNWLNGYNQEINYAIENDIKPSAQIKKEWKQYKKSAQLNTTEVVSPLISTKWDQSPYYNNLCPYDGTYGERAVTGCVATAMAQVMYFWQWPKQGTGYHEYVHEKYGKLSANFAATTYDWENMPTNLTTYSTTVQKRAIATLMYHCGVSVNMQYDVSANGGSGAYSISYDGEIEECAENAMQAYFEYTTKGYDKEEFKNSAWKQLLKDELDNSRPIIYTGVGSLGGHCFVCDGYNASDYFHFNWGWSGASDGYFLLNALNPSAIGTGGGSGGFNQYQTALFVEPNNISEDNYFDIQTYSDIELEADSIWYFNDVKASFKIANYGNKNFSGTVSCRIYDSEGNFFDEIENWSGAINAQKAYTFECSYKGCAKLVPGTYSIGLYYTHDSSEEWKLSGEEYHLSTKEFVVFYSDYIEPFSDFKLSSTPMTGEYLSVEVDVVNFSYNDDFYGSLRLCLSNLETGHVEQVIAVIDLENDTLPTRMYQTFTFADTVRVGYGTYLLELAYKDFGTDSWYYAGSTLKSNPIKIIVEKAPLKPDKYEENNDFAQSHELPVSFASDQTFISVTDANLHAGDDKDYYFVNLPEGYNYQILTTIIDGKYNEQFTVDAVVAQIDAQTGEQGELADNILNEVEISDGGKYCFMVAPFNTGQKGTYAIQIQIKREKHTAINDEINKLQIYPNPVENELNVKFANNNNSDKQLFLYDLTGNLIYTFNTTNDACYINMQTLPQGIYQLKINSNNEHHTYNIIKK